MRLDTRKTALFLRGSGYTMNPHESEYMRCTYCRQEFAVYGSPDTRSSDRIVRFCPLCGAQRIKIDIEEGIKI